MMLTILREPSTDGATIGSLFVDGVWYCWSLEDIERDIKIAGATAIPVGRYAVRLTYSPRFKMMLPEIQAVPGFSGVRIHAGNTASDTDGCILVGQKRDGATVLRSRMALEGLLSRFEVVPRTATHTCHIRRVLT
jgi:hypothetical protein